MLDMGRPRHLGIVATALAANSAYLAARHDATLFYFVNVAAHPLLGLALLALAWPWIRRGLGGLALLARLAAAPLALAVATGAGLLVTGATQPWRWLLWTHIACAAVGTMLLLAHFSRARLTLATRSLVVAACAAAAISPLLRYYADSVAPNGQAIRNPARPPLRMEGEGAGPHSPFFPSSADTNTGTLIPATFFMTSQQCRRCHPDIYDQWSSSAHHFSSFNNQWYRKAVEYMQDVVGTKPSRWCAGCHDHAVFFNGRFDRPIKEQIDTPEAQNGLGCTSCHSIVHVRSTMGQGDFEIEYPPLHDLATSELLPLQWAHDYLLKLDPVPHKRTFLKAFHTRQIPEFCSACHKVHLDVPVNDYRWFRGFDEYDAWQASGVSGEGARSFYYPPKPLKCADCHMPLVRSNDPAAHDGWVHSHRFPAANTALPFVNRDAEQLRVTQNFLRSGVVRVDVFGLVSASELPPTGPYRVARGLRLASGFGVGEEGGELGAATTVVTPPAALTAPLDRVEATLRRGDSARLEVVVRTVGVGHFFPGGTVDALDVWVEPEAVHSNGKKILHSGWLENGNGPVEPGAHRYRSLLLDEHGNPINKRNAWAARSVAYVRLIPPGAADTVHYRLRIPEDCADRVVIRASVNYRKFSWWNTQWAFAGVRDPQQTGYALGKGYDDGRWVFTGATTRVSGQIKAIPDLPVTEMASARAEIRILPRTAPRPAPQLYLDRSVRERWNDYGIGLLLQGDLRGAEAAFLRVTEMEPEYADGWVNVARVRLQEGRTEEAVLALQQALAVDPDLAKTHFFLGQAHKTLGHYDTALEQFRRAAKLYPRDRVVLNQIGRVLFLKRRYEEAIQELERVLAIDPEDLQAHYNLMLCYQGMGDAGMAERQRALYERFKIDEAAQFITGPYRSLHPYDNNERQAIHEHGPRLAEPRYTMPRRPQAGPLATETAGGGQ